MNDFEKSLTVMKDLFGRDYPIALATSKDNVPSLRVVDIYYEDGAFYVVTYRNSQKVQEILTNPSVALCNEFYRFTGKAYDIGHPLEDKNKALREKLMVVFEPWYFAHNNEGDENMCYVRIDLETGFFHKDKVGYRVDFMSKTAESFPFDIGDGPEI